MTNPFLHADGQRIINGQGHEVMLRGIGMGGWLLPEGYMWKFPHEGDRPRRIEAYFVRHLGADKARSFWTSYYQRFITLADIESIRQEGFNSIRIPLHYRFLLTSNHTLDQAHWAILDQVIDWCEQEKLYVILDLHGAPGGQTGTNIDDSAKDHPELFDSIEHQELTVHLWESLATRYKDREIIACYDLLNEPLPNWFSAYHPQLIAVYQRVIHAIRAIDPYHMISLEGAHWATDWSIFDRLWDDNVLYQFHKYWNNPDQASIQPYLDFRTRWNVPIFMGEGGENNTDWYIGAFSLLDEHHISWNFWTYKKMETSNSPYSIIAPRGWDELAQAIAANDRMETTRLEGILQAYLDGILLNQCEYHPEVAQAIFRRIPIAFPAIFYSRSSLIPSLKPRTNVGFRSQDNTEIRFLDSQRTLPHFGHGQGQPWAPDDWMMLVGHPGDVYRYGVTAKTSASHRISLRLTAYESAMFSISVGSQTINVHVMDTNRKSLGVGSFVFKPGENFIDITIRTGKVALEVIWVD